jgi:uncharacterized RDD family membrane protein YckC
MGIPSNLATLNQKTNNLVIRTPEGIVFAQPLAGPMTRSLAWMIDFLCLAVALLMARILLGLLILLSPELAQAMNVLLYFLLSLGYSMVLEWYWRGQTVGKRLLSLRVVDAHGLRLHPSQIVIRNLLRMVDILPAFYLVGGLACLLSRRAQRLGDFAANTVVVRIPKVSQPDLEHLLTGKYNSFRDYPHLEARLRQSVSPEEAAVALQAVIRRPELEAAARLELFHDLADHFRAKVFFPPEATSGLADEQYVRNVIDVLYRPRRERPAAQPKTEPVAIHE